MIPPAVELREVSLVRNDRFILNNITWSVSPKQQAAIVGPNGAGKSTLVRVLLGYLWPTRGTVTVAGCTFGQNDLHRMRHDVKLVQSTLPYEWDAGLSVREVIHTGFEGTLVVYEPMSDEQQAQVDRMIDRVGLGRVRYSRYDVLSTGEKVRTQLARALITRPKVLILDEPTAGLDIRGREELIDFLEDLGNQPDSPAVIVVTHHTEELPRNTGNVLLLSNGQTVCSGSPENVLTGDNLSQAYRCVVHVDKQDGRFYLRASVRGGK